MSEATCRLSSNDENWHQLWKEDGEGRELPYCELVNTDKETAQEIVRAVNTFDQAREALRLALGKLENLSKFSDEGGNLDPIRAALAAMEGQP